MEDQIKRINQDFYDAFNTQDLALMKKVWRSEGITHCIHPGWTVLRGHDSILRSWKDIFQNTGNLEIKVSDLEVIANGDFAWVSCQENLFSIHSAGVQESKVYATNLFQKISGHWKMVQHHASVLPGMD
tara:strand:- start:1497 stop:1883 length:387 start_codon:yes stop_codon:yes gene_type:complete